MIDERPDCYKSGKKEHKWVFDDETGVATCSRPGCPARLDTRLPFKKS